MDLILKRIDFSPDGIFSELSDGAGNLIAKTLEHAYEVNGVWVPKIPNGEYICERGIHQLSHMANFETFEITGVDGHSGLLFHVGNYDEDSEGCILLGLEIETINNTKMIIDSKTAFDKFMLLQEGINSFHLTVL